MNCFFCFRKFLWDIVRLWITKLVLILTCVFFIGLDIKWMRLSKPETSIKIRQAYTESILPISPKEALSHILSWKNKPGFVTSIVSLKLRILISPSCSRFSLHCTTAGPDWQPLHSCWRQQSVPWKARLSLGELRGVALSARCETPTANTGTWLTSFWAQHSPPVTPTASPGVKNSG